MRALIFIIALALAGCAAPKPQIVYVPKEVKIPVPIRCTPPKIAEPVRDFDNARSTDPLFNSIGLLAAENDHLNAYTTKLKAALAGCTK